MQKFKKRTQIPSKMYLVHSMQDLYTLATKRVKYCLKNIVTYISFGLYLEGSFDFG